jgi:HEAT repeat protein
MIGQRALIITAVVLAALVAFTVTLWLLHAAWSTARERRIQRRRPAALQALATATGDANWAPALSALAGLDADARIGAVVDMANTLAGAQRDRLNAFVRTTGIWTKALGWARSRAWGKRLRASRLITLFGDGTEAPGELHLVDRRPEVRAESAEWAGQWPTPTRVELLLAMLDDPDPRSRFAAREALIRSAGAALDAIEERLGAQAASPDLLKVATALAAPRFLEGALRLSESGDPAIRACATRLLGAIGGAQATAALEPRLTDPSTEVRLAAVEGLGSLGHWQAAGSVAERLHDEVWSVRHAAALALGRMGPMGTLLLRRASRGDDAAADTASYALGLPPALIAEV